MRFSKTFCRAIFKIRKMIDAFSYCLKIHSALHSRVRISIAILLYNENSCCTSRICFAWLNFYWFRSRIYSLFRQYRDYGLENSSSVVQSGRFLSREFRTRSPVRRCCPTISQLQVQPTPFSIAILALLIYNSPHKSDPVAEVPIRSSIAEETKESRIRLVRPLSF